MVHNQCATTLETVQRFFTSSKTSSTEIILRHFRSAPGHSGFRQGAQGMDFRRTRLFLLRGPVFAGSVDPNMATSGIPRAEATCIRPESLVMKRRQRAIRPAAWAREVLPVR